VRRGPYKRERNTKPAAAPEPPVTPATELDELLERVRKESPLRYKAGKELALRSIRFLMLEQKRLTDLANEGKLTAEEAKQINANASNLRRWFEAIGLTGAPKRKELLDPDDDDEPL
jgi:hypothetical protein